MEWYGAFGLIVTLVWLYLEILRLLQKIDQQPRLSRAPGTRRSISLQHSNQAGGSRPSVVRRPALAPPPRDAARLPAHQEATLAHFFSWALLAMASQMRTSRSPSAKVGKLGVPVQPEAMKL